jgi:hypothetical protein
LRYLGLLLFCKIPRALDKRLTILEVLLEPLPRAAEALTEALPELLKGVALVVVLAAARSQ